MEESNSESEVPLEKRKRKPKRRKSHRRIGPRRKANSKTSLKQPSDIQDTLDRISFNIVNEIATDHDYCASRPDDEEVSIISDNIFSDVSSEVTGRSTVHEEESSQYEGSADVNKEESHEYSTTSYDVDVEVDVDVDVGVEVQNPSPSNVELTTEPQPSTSSAVEHPSPSVAEVLGVGTSPILCRAVRKKRVKKLTTPRPRKKKVMPSILSHSTNENVTTDVAQTSGGNDSIDDAQTIAVGHCETLTQTTTMPSSEQVLSSLPCFSTEVPLSVQQHHFNEDDMTSLVDALTALMNDECVVHRDGTSIRILILTKSHNAAIDKSIYWDSGIARIYVHNLLVPKSHQIFKQVLVPSTINVQSVSEYIYSLVCAQRKFVVCQGVREYECLWRASSGHIDTILFEETPCFRHLQCKLLVHERPCCSECLGQLRTLRKTMVRKEEMSTKDKNKIPNSCLETHELLKKLKSLKKSAKLEKKRGDRLKSRLDHQKENLVKVNEPFHRDLVKILNKHGHKMTEIQKIFWQSQMDALKFDNIKSMHWHPMMIKIALRLQDQSDPFEVLKEFISLPSKRRLYDYSHVIDAKEGIQEEILKDLQAKVKRSGPEKHWSYVNVMFDEVHCRSGIVIRRSTNEIIGYTNLTEVETELQKLMAEMAAKDYRPALAKKVLVFLATGVTSCIDDVVAVYSTDDLTASQLFSRAWEVIYHLEEVDISVLCLTCDGASVNRKFFNMHPTNNSYSTVNLGAGDRRPLFFLLDPPHLVKTARNCFANSFAHKKSRTLWKNGQYMSWKAIEQLFNQTKEKKFRGHKLTKAHVLLTAFSRMKVSYAVQVFSASVARELEKLIEDENFNDFQMQEMIKFILLMNRFFDCVNGFEEEGKVLRNPDLAAYRSQEDERFTFLTDEFLKFFDDWAEDVKSRRGYTASEKARMMISHQTLKALKITVLSFIALVKFMLSEGAPSVNGRVFNQDRVEQFFSTLRRKRGDDNSLGVYDILNARNRLHTVGQIAFASTKGNTEVQKKRMEVDHTPLPALKRKHN